MLDLIYILVIVAFFGLAILYIEACDALSKGGRK